MTSYSSTCKQSAQAKALKDRGNAAFNAGDWHDAISYYTKALQARPNWGVVYSNRSHAYGKAGLSHEALKDAKKCVDTEGTWWKAHLRLGEAYMRLERYDEAVQAFNRSAALKTQYDRDSGSAHEL
eukprot:CAMPEP_0172202662 /NCGR_PEP_ID=MMETSP1050-20130122/30798_1 /TAXON_ID=233186 /ORGANISM="Cryptomonas curvata, Strain CCAP979/52" /LENGTH=125 /DNA_ID=CAMNT_0012880681 /DNA_START=140 /DNA_END=514 /DNA_ORIENTATION=+